MNTHNEVLVGLVWWLPLLLPRAHESSARTDARLDLWKVNLYHHTLLPSVPVADLRNTIPRTADFEEHLLMDTLLGWCDHELRLLQVASSTAGQVRLMLLPLRVREVRALVGVESKTETTFEGAKMVAEDVWVL